MVNVARCFKVVALSLIMFPLAACGSDGGDAEPPEIEALGGLPHATVDDFVLYGDFAVHFAVVDEVMINRHGDPLGTDDPPGTPKNARASEHDYVGRELSAKVVSVLWSAGRHEVPSSFSFVDWGWFPGPDGRPGTAVIGPGGLRLTPGAEYVGIFTVSDIAGPEVYGPLAPSTVYEVAGDSSRLILRNRTDQPPGLRSGEPMSFDDFSAWLATGSLPSILDGNGDPSLSARIRMLDPHPTWTEPEVSVPPSVPPSDSAAPSDDGDGGSD